MNDISVLVMSCDLYSDIWEAFFKCKDKYWENSPKTYLVSETKECKYCDTIKAQGTWTSRLKEALEQIDTKYVLFMMDDFFIRSKVDTDRINSTLKLFKKDTACFNFEINTLSYEGKNVLNGFAERNNKEPYLNSCQPSIHDRLKLIERLQDEQSAWEWELTQVDSPYKFYINKTEKVIDIGQEYLQLFGIARGKWTMEAYRFLKDFDIDFSKRGFFKGSLGEYENKPKLSIVIPYYKTYELTKILLDNLCNQITDEVQVILIDDGCNDTRLDNYPIEVIHCKKNGGLSYARNRGLEKATGKYLTFIDSDDDVSKDYIEKILNKIDTSEFDYCMFSFRYVGAMEKDVIIKGEPEDWNNCVWNCIYKRSILGKFDENIQMIEDKLFNQAYRKGKRENIEDILYNYLWGRYDSLSQRNARKEIGIDFKKYKLSIIIPYYKTLELTKKLLNTLIPQLKSEVEVILVDDGCNELELDNYPITVIHQENYGVSKARNTGLDIAQGKYIAFIDSDDMITKDYIKTILDKIKEDFDYCYLGFESSSGEFIIDKEPLANNTCVWNCIYNSNTIGTHRFPEDIQYGEEELFNLKTRVGKRENINKKLYKYNDNRVNSITYLHSQGLLSKYRPLKAQLVMFLKFISKIGGIETFLYEFFKEYHDKYDILFLYEDCDPFQLARYRKLVKCKEYFNEQIECTTFLNVNHTGNIANNVIATSGNYYDMVHTDYLSMGWKYTKHPKTTKTICVSEVGKRAFLNFYPKEPCEVIYNLLNQVKPSKSMIEKRKKEILALTTEKDPIIIISAARLSHEKGYERMKKFAKRLNERNIPFIWVIFTNDTEDEKINGLVLASPRYNVNEYIACADWYSSKSDTECCSYSNFEAFDLRIPIISTDYPSIYEQGMQVGKNGYILNMDMSNMDEVIDNIVSHKLKGFDYKLPNVLPQWNKLLGKKQKSSYIWDGKEAPTDIRDVWVALSRVKDDKGQVHFKDSEVVDLSPQRVRLLLEFNLIKRKDVI